jgi:hypothetical protein
LFRIGGIEFKLDGSDGIVWGKQVFLWVKYFTGDFEQESFIQRLSEEGSERLRII